MRFELEPDNRNCPDDVLLSDLQKVAASLGKDSLTKQDYASHGRFSPATMQKRFGSWNEALSKSGLQVAKRINIPEAELLADLKRAAAALHQDSITSEEYKQCGAFSAASIQRSFGTWAKALQLAGLQPTLNWRPKASDEALLSNLATLWETLGRQPKTSDCREPLSKFSAHSYKHRFGSWRQALEYFVHNADQPPSPSANNIEQTEVASTSPPKRAGSQRNPSWRLRFLVNRRDRFTCRACGRSPANENGVVLHVDHIVPWSKGGETTIDNLQTLCERCNIGKSDLAMHENDQ